MSKLFGKLDEVGQSHLLQFYGELSPKEQESLVKQIESINLAALPALVEKYIINPTEEELPAEIAPAPFYGLNPTEESDQALLATAFEVGEKAIAAGKVALCTVAGGQGTRLGYDGPKGTFPVSPIKSKSLFELFADQIKGLNQKYNVTLKWYIMTSLINHTQTQDFFQENNFFGLNASDVTFFTQGVMPVFGQDGKILLANKGEVAMAPDGHGGTLIALKNSGIIAEMEEGSIDYISYFQVDNPLVYVIDPLYVGLHELTGSEVSNRSLTKTNAFEKLGNFCIIDGKLQIIEYSDISDELATSTSADGELRFRAGSPAIHLFNRSFIDKITSESLSLPFHVANKKVPFVDVTGTKVTPTENNAIKLETFVFDAIPMASKAIVLEADRTEQFGPVKNATGVDSAESCQAMLQDKAATWLESAGVTVPRNADGSLNCTLELSAEKYPSSSEIDADQINLVVGAENYLA
ncbi:MAG: UDPGP type 1 family protein [Lentisphaeria bacterium]|nr:UDPGP type 1 family protein [Lentisphaeria bacterium]